MSLKKNSIRKPVIGVAAAGALGLAIFGVGSTGADFTASKPGSVSIQSANLSVNVSDDNNAHTFNLGYANLAPGDVKVDTFTVTNTGSIPADVMLGGVSLGANNLSGLTGPQVNMLTAGIDGYQATAPAASLTGNIPLGSLNAGDSRTYTVRVGLAQAAGNEWQNRNVAAGLTVTLKQ